MEERGLDLPCGLDDDDDDVVDPPTGQAPNDSMITDTAEVTRSARLRPTLKSALKVGNHRRRDHVSFAGTVHATTVESFKSADLWWRPGQLSRPPGRPRKCTRRIETRSATERQAASTSVNVPPLVPAADASQSSSVTQAASPPDVGVDQKDEVMRVDVGRPPGAKAQGSLSGPSRKRESTPLPATLTATEQLQHPPPEQTPAQARLEAIRERIRAKVRRLNAD